MKRIGKQFGLLFRPWPIRPLPVTTIATAFVVLLASAVVVSVNESTGLALRGQNAGWVLLLFVLYFALSFTVLQFAASATKKWPNYSAIVYHGAAILFSYVAVLARFLVTNEATPKYWQEPISQIRLFIVMMLIYYVLHLSIGIASHRISEEARQAKAAKEALEIQRGRLIVSQELTRRQIADFLHDRLQSNLVVLGMQLNRASESLDPEFKSVASAFVDEIERIRQFDVREASRALAPELDGPSLAPALNDLIRQYQSVIEVELLVDQQAPIEKQQRLGTYRIIEQALLNAAKHGAASWVKIEVQSAEQNLLIRLTNNGKDLSSDYSPGSGLAIIENWVALYKGTWTLESRDGLTVFEANLRLLEPVLDS